jgi:hypothetical protein
MAHKRTPEEYGDFQTPQALADQVCRFLAVRGVRPATVVEPTCGLGSFVLAALEHFPDADGLGFEIDREHVAALNATLATRKARRWQILCRSAFDMDWRATLRDLTGPVLVLGNPPWVTNARLGTLGSANLPRKSNVQGRAGLDALTGKSNFDISEWMLIHWLEALAGRRGWLAMLCKASVARKVLAHAWKTGLRLRSAETRSIDARYFFGAAVEAGLLVCEVSPSGHARESRVFFGFENVVPNHTIGWRDGQLVADVPAYERGKHLVGEGPYRWRSGMKHDCAKVMEFRKEAGGYRNGLGELVDLEDDYLYPLRKGGDVARGLVRGTQRWVLVPQRTVGEDTSAIAPRAPKTWRYLVEHGDALDRRRSSIYRNRPRFSVFGVGAYTFTRWKVAVAGFCEHLSFVHIGLNHQKPIVFDDTVYFLSFQTAKDARLVCSLLNSQVAKDFFSAFIFWDAKRPITAELLQRLDLRALAAELGEGEALVALQGT